MSEAYNLETISQFKSPLKSIAVQDANLLRVEPPAEIVAAMKALQSELAELRRLVRAANSEKPTDSSASTTIQN